MEKQFNFDMPGYCTLNVDVYENTQYDSYIDWLTLNGYQSVVDELDAETNSTTLTQFRTYASNQYTAMSLEGTMGFTTLSANDQKVGWCIQEFFINNGILCVIASTGSSAQFRLEETMQYWFPTNNASAPTSSSFVNGFDPTDSLYDSFRIDGDYYGGLTHFYTDLSLNDFVAAKFELNPTSSDEQWANVKDFRFELGDFANVYGMFQEASGTINWNKFEQVKLGALSNIAFSAATLATAALLTF